MKRIISIATAALCSTALLAAPKPQTLESPDGTLTLRLEVSPQITYSLSSPDGVLVKDSPISVTLRDGTVWGRDTKAPKVSRKSTDRTFDAPVYLRSKVRDNYNELTLNYKAYSVIFRAYNDGIAYRFVSQGGKAFTVASEQVEFNLPEGSSFTASYVREDNKSFFEQFNNSFENTYTSTKVTQWNPERLAFLPVVVDEGKVKLCISESDLLNYPGMYLSNTESGNSLKGVFAPYPKEVRHGGYRNLQGVVVSGEDYIATFDYDSALPWRIVAVSHFDKDLADNDIVYRLGTDPDASMDFSWVKPGKVAWDWWNDWNIAGVDFRAGINNETYKYYIDFAASKGIEYVILDEGWSVRGKADLFLVVPEINIKELVDYGAAKGVGIILWAGYWPFNEKMEEVCKYYSELGVKGFKVDFMNRDDQEMVAFQAKASQVAAKYHLMLDFHGTFKPAGLNRTWPNAINFEGVHGLEQMKWSGPEVDQVTYDVTIPFIRFFAGPADYTQGAMRNATQKNYRPVNSEPMSQGTRCRQLAEYVVFTSPLNMLCDSPTNYLAEPECTDFIAKIPTVWDETIALDGKIGDYVIMARRKGDIWYVGGMTDWEARDFEVDLSFLPEGNWKCTLFSDGVNADRIAKDYKKESCELPSRKLTVHAAPGGGFAAIINK